MPCAKLNWPFRQLLSARKHIVSYILNVRCSNNVGNRLQSCSTKFDNRPKYHLVDRSTIHLWCLLKSGASSTVSEVIYSKSLFVSLRLFIYEWRRPTALSVHCPVITIRMHDPQNATRPRRLHAFILLSNNIAVSDIIYISVIIQFWKR